MNIKRNGIFVHPIIRASGPTSIGTHGDEIYALSANRYVAISPRGGVISNTIEELGNIGIVSELWVSTDWLNPLFNEGPVPDTGS